jgi:RNA polymerase sigma-70 factor (ECF subfamily)
MRRELGGKTPLETLRTPKSSFDTVHMQEWIQRWKAGDIKAADSLFRAVSLRLELIGRRMLRRFPAVRAATDSADVIQGSLVRLLQTLRRIEPESTRHFFNLAALHVRRELLDLARKFRKTEATRFASADATGADVLEGADAPAPSDDLDLWCRFHEGVEQLPAEERELIGLAFYHGWTQAQIADLFQVNERTIRRRWHAACLHLNQLVGYEIPRH